MIDYHIPEKEQRRLSKLRRPDTCPTKKICVPISSAIGSNDAGCCVGLLVKLDDLDCIKHCKFIREEDNTLETHQYASTPLEAMDYGLSLLEAIFSIFDYSKEYQKQHKDLARLRVKGIFNKHNLGLNVQ